MFTVLLLLGAVSVGIITTGLKVARTNLEPPLSSGPIVDKDIIIRNKKGDR